MIFRISGSFAFIQEVISNPDARHILVTIAVPRQVLEHIRSQLPMLTAISRTEAANAIHRKRVPSIRLEVVALPDGESWL